MYSQLPSSLLKLLLITAAKNARRGGAGISVVSAHTNFCGKNWGDASSDCEDRQPCPEGTDEECTNGGICWADTNCNSALGHGILYDLSYISHSRFCGTGWTDANANCSLKRHCPSGDPADCGPGEICFSFLADCNYVTMIGGPPKAAPGGGGADGDAEPPRTQFCGSDWADAVANCDRDDHWCPNGADTDCPAGKICFAETECKIGQPLPKGDPSRSNFCGTDWNDAVAHCDAVDHWCPNGADEDCPEGKICFAGTDCTYVADLFPTVTPTNRPTDVPTTPFPSVSPTLGPVVYGTVENGRFCGAGWEAVRDTCRIGSHCPSGDNAVCPGTQTCYSWVMGCNIIDFQNHYRETGREIFGSSHWLLPAEGLEGLEDIVSATNADGTPAKPLAVLPPTEILGQYGGMNSGPSPQQSPGTSEGAPVTPSPTLSATDTTTLHPLWDRVGCPEKYNTGEEYIDGSLVFTGQDNGSTVYKCKPYPLVGYCIQHAPDSNFGYLGWELLGSCVGTFAPTPRPVAQEAPTEFLVQYSGEVSGQSPGRGQVDEDAPVVSPPTSSAPVVSPPTSSAPIYPPTFPPIRWVTLQPVVPTSPPSKPPSKHPTPLPSSKSPTSEPTDAPVVKQTNAPMSAPPTRYPTKQPTPLPTSLPSTRPTTNRPTSFAGLLVAGAIGRQQQLGTPSSSSNNNNNEDSSSNNNVNAQETRQQSNDPDSLCTRKNSIKLTGYKATLDCRGYVYCRDGYVMGGGADTGVIACQQNQLFDERTSVCKYWQDVNTNLYCPKFDGSAAGGALINSKPLTTPKPTAAPVTIPTIAESKPRPSTATVHNLSTISSAGKACSSNDHCQPGQFCYEMIQGQGEGYCGFCSSDGTGCPTNEICRIDVCRRQDESGVSKCFRLGELDEDCGSGADDSVSMYSNPEWNSFFCGATFTDIKRKCLLSKPCPGGFASRFCGNNEGCFSVASCTAEYSVATENNVPLPPHPPDAKLMSAAGETSSTEELSYTYSELNQGNLNVKPTTPLGSHEQADKCSLCGNTGQLKSSDYVTIDSNHISCGDFALFLSENKSVKADQCRNFRGQYSGKCCNIDRARSDCSLCGDSSLDLDASVFFSGEAVSCHELESRVMLEEDTIEQCETHQRLYFGICCIQVPENPCHLCNSKDGSRLNMESNSRVSYAGEVKTCVDMYHFLYARQEESSEHCIGAQGELFDLCCESTESRTTPLYSFGVALPIDMHTAPGGVSGGASSPLTPSSTQKPSSEFTSWYSGYPRSSNASSSEVSFWSLPFLVVGLMVMT